MKKPIGHNLRRALGALLAMGFGGAWYALAPHAQVEAAVHAKPRLARLEMEPLELVADAIPHPIAHGVEPLHEPMPVKRKRRVVVAIHTPPTDTPLEVLQPIGVLQPQPDVLLPEAEPETPARLPSDYLEKIRTRSS